MENKDEKQEQQVVNTAVEKANIDERVILGLKQWHWFAILSFLLIMVAAGSIYGWYIAQPVSSSGGHKPVLIEVKAGMTAGDIAELLYQKELIRNVFIFDFLAKNEGMQRNLKAGVYAFTPDMTLYKIIEILNRGETAYVKFTIPEGYTINQIAKLIEEKKLGSAAKFKELAVNFAPYDYMKTANGDVTYKAEGFVFPDTYSVVRGISEEQLLLMMVKEFDSLFTESMRKKAKAAGWSIREVVTLASLVEREAQLPEERAVVASVFINRLKIHMPLQSCATIQYILGEPKAELSTRDTELPSPYNTYIHSGLPPGPIANPGIACINAVLEPAQTGYLYFVVNGQGGHHFSRTYEEHLAAMK